MFRGLPILILTTVALGLLSAGGGQAQTPAAYEVRTFLDSTLEPTHQFRQSAIKQRYVCPFCSYTSPYPGNCPDPWNVPGHPVPVALADLLTNRRQRVLSLATPDMAANRRDVEIPDSSGTLHGRAVLGRPFQPQGPDSAGANDARRSRVRFRVANVNGTLPNALSSRYRFQIIPPTPQSGDSGTLRSRRPMAQVDPDLAGAPPRGLHMVASTAGARAIPDNQLPNFIQIGINPYRVDEGDVWTVRYTEVTSGVAGRIRRIRLEVYSVLYGLEADLDYNPLLPFGGPQVNFPVGLMTESGALRVNLPQFWHQAAPWQNNHTSTWTMQFMVRSNCRLMPSWSDVVTATDPLFTDLAGSTRGNAGFVWTTPGNFPPRKNSYYAAAGTPAITDTSNVVATGAPAAPYIMPHNLTGQGAVCLQYSDSPALNTNWWPLEWLNSAPAGTIFYRALLVLPAGQWHYDANNTVGNDEVVNGTASFGTAAGQAPYVRLIASRFMSTRVDVPPTQETWNHGTASENAEVDPTAGWAYPRVIMGATTGAPPTVTGDYPPGSITPYRSYKVHNRWNGGPTATMVCPTCGMVWGPDAGTPPAQCPYHAGAVVPINLHAAGGGAYTGYLDSWRTTLAAGLDERVTPAVARRHVLRADAFEHANNWVGSTSGYKFGGTSTQVTNVRIPRYQPPSVPAGGTNAVNNPTNDRGYRGGKVIYRANNVSGSTGMTSNWDAFFKCPDCGQFVNADDPATHSCGSPHYYCPVCGSEHLNSGNCPFDGETLVAIPANQVCRHEHLQAEEFDALEMQVSVNRKAEVASTLASTEIGRTAPGVPTIQPDTTIGPISAHRAYPSDVSPLAPYLMRNEGNINVPLRIGNVHDFSPSNLDQGLYDYHRVQLDPNNHSYARLAQEAPLTRDTFRPFDTGMVATPNWSALPASSSDPAGRETWGYVTAGSYTGTTKPVPLGQPVGTYTGAQLHYIDANGNGAFDFYSVTTGGNVTTATTRYVPAADRPLEPLCGIVPGVLRVTESRLPHNDSYARDGDPVAIISMPDSRLQVIWASNRVSTDPAVNGSAAPGTAAVAGMAPGAIPSTTSPQNLICATATGATGGNDDPLYRMYFWPTSGGVLNEATMLSADPAGTVNSAPAAMLTTAGGNSTRWAFWHRRTHHAGGVESTLRYDTSTGGGWTWSGSGATEFIYDTGLPKQNLRGFPTAGGAWLFWHSGQVGRERLMYRWNFTGATDTNEGPVPVTNQALPGRANDVMGARDWDGSATQIRKPSSSPFTYTKDPSVFVESNVVNLFFSGYLRSEDQADICWTRYDFADMRPSDEANPGANYGKLAFTRVTNEEFRPDGLRQRFGSQHLDWLVRPGFEGDHSAAPPAPEPNFELRLAYDALGDGNAPVVQRFAVTWSAADGGNYLRARGTYQVTPILYPLAGAVLPAASRLPVTGPDSNAGPWYLRDPNTPATAPRPVTLEIDPASGLMQFSSPLYNMAAEEYRRLYNASAPTDRTCVFNSAALFSGRPLSEVLLVGAYTPYIWRVTRSGAHDDSPSAFYGVSTARRLTVFWRRSYPTSEAPHFGRASFMYRVLSNAVQLGRPAVSGNPTFTDLTAGGAAAPLSSDAASGVYTFDAARDGHYLRVVYNGAGGVTYTEQHQIIGWSTENVVPVDTVIGEGPVVAAPEVYDVPVGGGNTLPAVRYWLFWSSPRSVYDLRLVEDPRGSRYNPASGGAPDLPVHGSTDIHTAIVAPEFEALRPELRLSSVTADPT